MTRSARPKWIKSGIGKVPIGKGSNLPMKFRDSHSPRPAHNKGRKSMHMAKDNKK